ncbi:MAG TPA: enoyl-CoA hydratase-related protein [Acidimicrobiales bacterium]|nr:enoyl-CoA hydratase-related protein [Acidimicrobiales bacterium]
MPTPLVTVEDAAGVRLVTWNRPDALNAFNDEVWDGTRDALLGAQADPELRCVVLTGTGRAFSAGQDLGEMLAPVDHGDGELHGYRGFIPVLEEFDKPLLAAVNGIGVGIGATILPYCDIVWIDPDARLKVPFVTLGVTTEAAGSLLLPQRMGWQAAAHFVFTGDWLSAEDAVACGLAFRATEPGAALDDAMATARRLGELSVDSLQTTKRLMVAARLDAGRAAREREDAEFVRMVGSGTNAEALAGFLEG